MAQPLIDQHMANDRVHMHVLMRIGVVEPQSGLGEGLELGGDLLP